MLTNSVKYYSQSEEPLRLGVDRVVSFSCCWALDMKEGCTAAAYLRHCVISIKDG